MPRPLPHHRQRGASLIVAIVFLLLLGTLALTGLRASTTNVTIVGNYACPEAAAPPAPEKPPLPSPGAEPTPPIE